MSFSSHAPRKRFGQHWLKDASVLEEIVKAADLETTDRVLEIGPGRGVLTEKLLKSSASLVHGVELDRDLIDLLICLRFIKGEYVKCPFLLMPHVSVLVNIGLKM